MKEEKASKSKREKTQSQVKRKKDGQADTIRVEHLNYKVSMTVFHHHTLLIVYLQRISVGMKLLGQVMSVEPLALIVSLPNQLLAHVPITNVSSQLTSLLETMEEDENMSEDGSDTDEGHTRGSRVPELFELFRPGQYVRTIVTAVHAQGATDSLGLSKARDEALKASRRVELSLVPEKVNEGLGKSDLKSGLVSERCSLTIRPVHAVYRLSRLLSRVSKTTDTPLSLAFQRCQASSHSRMPRRRDFLQTAPSEWVLYLTSL